MLYIDYNWFLTPTTIIPDNELNTDTLAWKTGDYWQVAERADGGKFLKKVNPPEKFTPGADNE